MSRPIISEYETKKIVSDFYGLNVIEIQELLGYDDKNFLVKVDADINENKNVEVICEIGYVFKVVNLCDSENEILFDGQSAVLFELEEHKITAPKPVLTVDNKPFAKVKLKSGEHIVRLLEFIEGTTLFKIERLTSDMCFQVGQLTAKLDNTLENFKHPAYEKSNCILWSIASVSSYVKKYLHTVTDHSRRKLCQTIISAFSKRVMSRIDTLETGVIHGDINTHNLLMEKDDTIQKWNLKAIIDFGDTNRGCYIFELAIAMMYMMLQSNDSDVIDNGGYVMAGYLSIRNIPEEELDLLVICILARLVQSLVMGAYANLQDPNNTYVLTTAIKGWTLLTELSKIPEDDLMNKWKETVEECRKKESPIKEV